MFHTAMNAFMKGIVLGIKCIVILAIALATVIGVIFHSAMK